MPHQCVKCSIIYEDGKADLLGGCQACGGKLFFYITKARLEKIQNEEQIQLTKKQKSQIEHDVYDLIGDEVDREKPIILDFESIKILSPGKYELDLVNLFNKKQPLIYKLEDGKYMIDLIETFKKIKRGKS